MAVASFSSVGAGVCLMFCVTPSSSYFQGYWRSPSSGGGSGNWDCGTSLTPILQGLHWVCQVILRSVGHEEKCSSAALRQLASKWAIYLSCEWAKKRIWRLFIICKLFVQSHHYVFLNSKYFLKDSELSEVIHITQKLSILLKDITTTATLVSWVYH